MAAAIQHNWFEAADIIVYILLHINICMMWALCHHQIMLLFQDAQQVTPLQEYSQLFYNHQMTNYNVIYL
jgi:hypothetical protein